MIEKEQEEKEKTFTPHIIALSQQSRFHTATFDEFGKNILLNQVNLSIATSKKGKNIDLLVDKSQKFKIRF
jgi:hypothetical protein